MGRQEGPVESRLKSRIEGRGGKCLKWSNPSNKGVPDRIVFFRGYVVFVELKAPGEKPEPHQLAMHRQLRGRGAEVWVIDTVARVDAFVEIMMQRPKLPGTEVPILP